MNALVLILAVSLALSVCRSRHLRRVVGERDRRIALVEASWAALAAKYEELKRQQSEPARGRVPTNEEIERGVW